MTLSWARRGLSACSALGLLASCGGAVASSEPATGVTTSTEVVRLPSTPQAAPIGPIVYPERWDVAVEIPFAPAEAAIEVTAETQEMLDEIVEASDDELDLAGGFELDDSVLFAKGTAEITAAADDVLAGVAAAAAMQLGPAQRLRVDGFVDEVGTVEFNDRLATERANAVAQRLIRHQPALEGRIDAVAHGEDDLRHPGCRGDCPTNRVVVLTVVP